MVYQAFINYYMRHEYINRFPTTNAQIMAEFNRDNIFFQIPESILDMTDTEIRRIGLPLEFNSNKDIVAFKLKYD